MNDQTALTAKAMPNSFRPLWGYTCNTLPMLEYRYSF